MKKTISLLILFLLCIPMSSEDNHHAVKTSVVAGRYEIIQSEIARKITLRIDKYLGIVDQLVKDSDDNLTWEYVYRENVFADLESVNKDTINYQIFMGGIFLSDCFLLNIHSGQTWQLCNDPTDNTIFWKYMKQ